jgi:uncharacterized membrane protein YdbT with pleckstrin-like domain
VSFPSRLLNQGEHIVVTTRTHVKALLVPALLLIVLAAVAGFLVSIVPESSAKPLVQLVIWLLAGLVAIWWVVKPFLGWLTTSYTFTNRRFIKRSGFVAKQGRTIPLNRISGVDFEIGIVDRVFGCGTLVLLHDIPHVERVQMQVSEELHRLSSPGSERTDDGA